MLGLIKGVLFLFEGFLLNKILSYVRLVVEEIPIWVRLILRDECYSPYCRKNKEFILNIMSFVLFLKGVEVCLDLVRKPLRHKTCSLNFIFFLSKASQKKKIPLFDFFSETSQDIFGFHYQSHFPWDVCLNSSKSGMFFFAHFFVFGNLKNVEKSQKS